jgi:hypothetical protein
MLTPMNPFGQLNDDDDEMKTQQRGTIQVENFQTTLHEQVTSPVSS